MSGFVRSLCLVSLVVAVGCSTNPSNPDGGNTPPPDASPPDAPPPPPAPSAVYVMSNELDANRIVVFERATDGSLRADSAYATGGKGAAGGLGSQGALVFDAASQEFLAVNAGDNSISLLALESSGALTSRSTVASGGMMPISITRSNDVVYVVNAGDATNAAGIAGFRIANDKLSPIAGSTRPLSAAQVGPAQIEFSPDGALLVVTEKGTNLIDTYPVAAGVAGDPKFQTSAGTTPFGFAFAAGGQLLVSEAFGGADGLGAASSYAMAGNGTITPISSSVASTQSAPCWLVVANGHAYVTNTKSSTISSYTVAANGALTLDQANGIAASAGMGPIDAAAAGGYLYTLDAKDHAISVYTIGAGGSLTRGADLVGVAPSAVGLVVR